LYKNFQTFYQNLENKGHFASFIGLIKIKDKPSNNYKFTIFLSEMFAKKWLRVGGDCGPSQISSRNFIKSSLELSFIIIKTNISALIQRSLNVS
jgi:hypothetical protein